MDKTALTQALKQRAREIGFAAAGVCRAQQSPGLGRLQQWLEAGYAGDMDYFHDRWEAYASPAGVLPGARSLLVLALPYWTQEAVSPKPGQGRVSVYAWSDQDYHDVIHRKLKQLRSLVRELAPDVLTRGVVDTAPLMEREFAQLAGLGWVGKNTLLLSRQLGSWFFLAVLLLDCELDDDTPFAADHCGTCTACLDICPTNAFPQPYVLDARRCISYLTIEHRGSVPDDLRSGYGQWVFGCDLCQEVCPWNRKISPVASSEFAPQEDMNPVELGELFYVDDAAFRARFRKTPLWRARRRGLLRNAAIVLGNQPTPEGLAPLIRGLSDEESLVRGASAWALGNFSEEDAVRALAHRNSIEPDPYVQNEIQRSLDRGQRL
jgi:epoxyqueuosine reductase